ncbi:4-hydroxyphenylpyruvate dioxygenase-like protein [Actinia tenebrosa]|uniref:4-hydroxyphenylpyruvate dioxygenase-like protein n=1 Tax=Actinia tenebrosa TaxID=6105 RepID=A0A6P8IRF0_ACTTE|nr:4-hydroxyphenylpyruvate dioxygenase-like protein [Actinia tenebrosa]
MVLRLHHVEFLCKNIRFRLGQFCEQFGFRPFAQAVNPRRVAIKRNTVCFVFTEDTTITRDSVFNVTFEVKDVNEITKRVFYSNGGNVLVSPTTLSDSHGQILSSVIETPCENVLHTLIDKSNYDGPFLPGFYDLTSKTLEILPENCRQLSKDEDLVTHIDHIAFACHRNSSLKIIDWYEKCFGFTRFELNDKEEEDGFKIESFVNGSYVGMKLTAMEYWKCAEVGIEVKSNDPRDGVKFVLAEALPGQGLNQIQTFLEEHGGPGVQHIGLHTTDIVHAVDRLKKDGVQFVTPPDAYYTQPDKIKEILKSGLSVEDLKHQNILLDAESFTIENDNKAKYLMQVFTKPLFDRNTFFMEIIQRFGATGFGSGNITALWRALDQHLRKRI